MKVTMVTTGTYPQSFGGVSVWCDQIVRGLPQIDFEIHAISAIGRKPLAWRLPGSVTVTQLPLWAAVAPLPGSQRPGRGTRRRAGEPVGALAGAPAATPRGVRMPRQRSAP